MSSGIGSIEVGGGGTTTGSSSQVPEPWEMVTKTTSPSSRPWVVSQPFLVVVEGRTSIGIESTATWMSGRGATAVTASSITIKCGVIESPASG